MRHPAEFKNYFDERGHELNLIKSVMRNLNPGEKRALREHFQQEKKMTFDDFQRLVGLEKVRQGRVEGRGERPAKGGKNPFDLKRRQKEGEWDPIRGGWESTPEIEDDLLSVSTNDTSFSDLLY